MGKTSTFVVDVKIIDLAGRRQNITINKTNLPLSECFDTKRRWKIGKSGFYMKLWGDETSKMFSCSYLLSTSFKISSLTTKRCPHKDKFPRIVSLCVYISAIVSTWPNANENPMKNFPFESFSHFFYFYNRRNCVKAIAIVFSHKFKEFCCRTRLAQR